MKISNILLFMAGVLASLAAICVLMPEDGIQIGGVRLEFPTLLQTLSTDEEEGGSPEQRMSPEELIESRMATLQTSKEDEFRQFAQNSPQRIYMPGGDETYLDPFFAALEQAGQQHVRILHLGDSQLECDRISSSLREKYQQAFGGHGVGLVPALQTVATYTLSQSVSPSESVGHYLAYGPADVRASHSRYGVMAQVNHVVAGTTLRFSARDTGKHPCSGGVRRVTVMAKGSGGMELRAGGETYSLTAVDVNDAFSLLTATLRQGVDALTLTVHGNYDIYGIQLDDVKGVSVDNVPMRGCSGTIFTKIDEQTMAPFFQHENVRLLILQYGGNSVPSCSGSKSISSYMSTLRRQIALFRRMAPDTSILFIGPADMATRMHGEMKTYPILPEMVDSLREMSLQEGIAFWDMYSAMGGKGSIVRWYKASPQLAGGDFVHFTPKGAEKMADMLYGTLQLYYRFYRVRTGRGEEDEMRHVAFQDTVAPVEGSSVILVSELPPRSSADSTQLSSDLDWMEGEEPDDAGSETGEEQSAAPHQGEEPQPESPQEAGDGHARVEGTNETGGE